jgi:hypothetical protein
MSSSIRFSTNIAGKIKTWRSGEQFQHPLPQTDDNPWMTCNGIVEKFDKDMCDVWKDEIQNLLIFVSFFSLFFFYKCSTIRILGRSLLSSGYCIHN